MSIAGKSITLDVQKIDITPNTRNTTLNCSSVIIVNYIGSGVAIIEATEAIASVKISATS